MSSDQTDRYKSDVTRAIFDMNIRGIDVDLLTYRACLEALGWYLGVRLCLLWLVESEDAGGGDGRRRVVSIGI